MWINPETREISEEPREGWPAVIPTFPPQTLRFEKPVEAAPEFYGEVWRQVWRIEPLTSDEMQQVIAAEAQNEAHRLATERAEYKANRQRLVDSIKVTIRSGKQFDGGENSQSRMMRALAAMREAGMTSMTWILADNIKADVSTAELSEALTMAVQEQTRIWVEAS